MSSAEDVLAAMGFSVEEAAKADESQKDRKTRDPRVCLCGHAINRHTTPAGVVVCRPSQMSCPCKNIRPVVEVEDTRLFLRKTNGPGLQHALTRGLGALGLAGKEAKWIVPLECDRCEEPQGKISVVPINNASKTIADRATGYDALLCEGCVTKL